MMELEENDSWTADFPIQSIVDLDFVIGQSMGWPVGMTRKSPPEFRRRILAALVSSQLRLSSIDYALKRYVPKDQYEEEKSHLGDVVSDFLKQSCTYLKDELLKLHTEGDILFGQFGAELTLYKFPETLDLARQLSNRGSLLEVLPILRLCLEMSAWSSVSFFLLNEESVMDLKAQKCISKAKKFYATAGNLYGYFSKFSHWEYDVHAHFLNFSENDKKVRVISASRLYRAMSLTLSLIILDIFVEAVRHIYQEKSEPLIIKVQGTTERSMGTNIARYINEINALSEGAEITEVLAFFCER